MEYLKRVLGIEVLYENKALEHLPNFISTRYDSQKVSLSGQKAVFLYPKTELESDTKTQTKAVSDLIHLIDEIPMDGKSDYDVLGFIYEYLISQFAANAGKKAGEFYTPHEVSVLMSEIIAYHLKGRDEIKIYESKVQTMIQFSDCLAA